MRKKITNAVLLLLIAATWFLIGWTVRSWRLGPDVILVEQARQKLLSQYPGELPTSRELTYAAIRGMLRQVGDPHAALFEPSISQRFWDDFRGQSGTIGLYAEPLNGEIVVSVVFPGEPADQAGLRPGDVVLSVDGVEFDDTATAAEVQLLIRGPVGAAAHFVIRRDQEILEFDPVRQERLIAEARMLDDQVGYLAQYTFTANASEKVKQALEMLLAQGSKALVWDLRSNGGGSMLAAQEVLSYFIGNGLLFTAELKGGERKPFLANGDGIAAEIPLVVLVGEHTISSAETAAAAIKDRERGILIGSTTFGKGTIQTTDPLIEDSMLHMTVAKWLSPNGQWFDGRGVTPDILVNDNADTEQDEVLQYALDYVLSATPLANEIDP